MNFASWQGLAPAAAAAEFTRRLGRLPAAQRRAAVASVPGLEEVERRFAAAPPGQPLSGVPGLVKDLFDVQGEPTRAGSTFLPEVRPRPAAEDGAFARALRAAGLVLAGKTHMVEFAYGLTGENAHFGDCVRPGFPDRTSGGSSSGSAVAVAAGLVPFAAASDTGGSIRVPAAFCGIYGLRLSPHQAWIADAMPLAPSFDTAGWFTGTAEDMGIALQALVPAAAPTPRAGRGCYLAPPGLEPGIETACAVAAGRLAPPAEGRLKESLLADFADGARAYQVLGGVEAWRAHESWFPRFRDRYDPAVRLRLEQASRWSAGEVAAAQGVVERTRRRWNEYFADYDFLVLPATPFPALRPADFTQENRMRLLALTTPASIGGWPALALPVPLGDASGLTGGLQIVVANAGNPTLRLALREWASSWR
jgi:aspartyl-tRNA(Asn)/glutamyl-tRNA(Gln) amidotransferase subunit A